MTDIVVRRMSQDSLISCELQLGLLQIACPKAVQLMESIMSAVLFVQLLCFCICAQSSSVMLVAIHIMGW
jgi:hypothetical protein